MNPIKDCLLINIDTLRVLLGLCIKYTDNGEEKFLSWEVTPAEARQFADSLNEHADKCEKEAMKWRAPYTMCEYKDAEEYRERTLCGSIGLEGSWSKWIPGKPEKTLMNREYQCRKRNDLKMKAAVDPAQPGADKSAFLEIAKQVEIDNEMRRVWGWCGSCYQVWRGNAAVCPACDRPEVITGGGRERGGCRVN